MMSLEELRKVEPKFKDLPDEELTLIRQFLYALGELVFDRWLAQRNGSKNPRIDRGRNNDTMTK